MASLMDDFTRSFDGADRLYLMDVYPAGEDPIPGVTSERLARMIPAPLSAEWVASGTQLIDLLETECRPGDLLLTLGAGDVWKIGEEFLERSH
jgi:UDP-N-acetylmuramate--alanine ligase